MKNLVLKFALLVFAGTICSFQPPKPALQEIFQAALDTKSLEDHFAKNNEGELLPLTLISNDYIATDMPLNFAKNKVFILSNLTNSDTQSESILEITEIELNRRKSRLSFKYADKTIKIRLKKEHKKWVAKIITVKWKNGFQTQIVEYF